MRRTIPVITTSLLALLLGAGPALAAEGASPARPWHYWIAFFLIGGAVLFVAAVALGYYFRVVGGRSRR